MRRAVFAQSGAIAQLRRDCRALFLARCDGGCLENDSPEAGFFEVTDNYLVTYLLTY